jgi:Holliday junction DNA helicase RuvA
MVVVAKAPSAPQPATPEAELRMSRRVGAAGHAVIGRLRGAIVQQGLEGLVILEVGGVGYEVHVPLGTVGRLPDGGAGEATLHVHTHVREDALILYGFDTPEDKAAFRALLTVNSIGPKLALAILSSLSAPELAQAIAREEKARSSGISGVGSKTVERILLDLKDKLLFTPTSTATPRAAVKKPTVPGGDRGGGPGGQRPGPHGLQAARRRARGGERDRARRGGPAARGGAARGAGRAL